MAGIGLPTTKWDENIIQAAPHILQLFWQHFKFVFLKIFSRHSEKYLGKTSLKKCYLRTDRHVPSNFLFRYIFSQLIHIFKCNLWSWLSPLSVNSSGYNSGKVASESWKKKSPRLGSLQPIKSGKPILLLNFTWLSTNYVWRSWGRRRRRAEGG